MKRTVKSVAAVITAVLLILLTACTSTGTMPDPAETMASEEFPLSPEVPASSQYLFTLYFGLNDEDYLASEARYVTVSGGNSETALVTELIKGPGVSNNQLISVINTKTKLVGIERSGDYLYVTLSKEFLEPVLPVTEETMTEERQTELKQRMLLLSVYSIVNTLTELGNCTRVQILIDTDNTGEGIRPTRSVLGLAAAGAEDADTLVNPLSRRDDLILNPSNTVQTLMKAMTEKNWERVEKFTALNDAMNNTTRSDKETFLAELALSNPEVLSYEVREEHISVDGQNAVVVADIQMQSTAGAAVNSTEFPMRLLREDGIWKLSYASMAILLKTAG